MDFEIWFFYIVLILVLGRIIPKMPFGVYANVKSSNPLEKGASQEITVALYEWRKDGTNVTKDTGRLDIMKDTAVKVCSLLFFLNFFNHYFERKKEIL